MAITIPILTTFNGRGVDRGIAQFKSLGTKGQKAGFLIRKAAIPAAAALGGLALGAKAAVSAASDLGEETSKSEAIFGKTAATVQKFAGEQGAAFGLSKTAALDAANSMAVYGKAAGLTGSELGTFSTDLVKLSGDLASFSNVDVQTAADALKSGLAGESEPLKKFGILMNDATLKATALKMGIIKTTKQALTPQQKVLAANRLIFEQTTDAQGDAARTSGSFANRQRQLTATLENMKAELGTALLPIVEKFAGWLTKVAGFLAKNTGLVKAGAVAIGALSAGILVLNAVMKIQNAIMLASPFAWIALAIAGVTIAVITLYKKSETFRTIVQKAWAGVKAAVKAVVDFFDGPVKAAWKVIENTIKTIAALVKGDFSGAWDAFKGVVKGVIDWVKETLIALPATILTLAGDIGLAILNGIKNGVTGLATTIWETIKGLPGYLTEKAAGWASSLKGIGTSILNWIKENVTGLAGKIWGQIKGFAKALADKVGEKASNIKGIGSSIIGWIGDGIKSAATSLGGIVKSAINTVIDGLNTGISGLNSAIDLLNKVNPFEDVPNIPTIPKLAKGGIVTRPTLALIGEAGPEAVIPLNSRHGFGRSQNITINVQAGLVSSPDQVGQQIIEAIQRAQRRSGPAFMPA